MAAWVAAGIVVVAVTAAACTSGDDGADEADGTLRPPNEDGRGFELLLERAAAAMFDSEEATADYVDVELAEIVTGLDDASEDERLAALTTMFVDTVQTPPELFAQRGTEIDAFREELGFSVLDVDRSLDVLSPPEQALIMETSVDPAQIDEAVRSDPVWSPLLDVDTVAGHEVYDWDDGAAVSTPDPGRSTAARPLGRGGQLAIVDGTVTRTVSRSTLVATLGAFGDPETSIARRDDVAPLLAEVAGGETEGRVIQGYLQARPPAGWSGPVLLVDLVSDTDGEPAGDQAPDDQTSDDRTPDGADPADEGPGDASGGSGAGQRTGLLVLAADDAEEASARADAIRATYETATSLAFALPFTDVVPDLTVTTNGPLVVLTSPADLAFTQLRIVLQTADPLLDIA